MKTLQKILFYTPFIGFIYIMFVNNKYTNEMLYEMSTIKGRSLFFGMYHGMITGLVVFLLVFHSLFF